MTGAARLVLVRPDQHIAWIGDAAPADLPGSILEEACHGLQTAFTTR